MKKILMTLVLLATSNVYATPVDGEIFYKLPDGNLAIREVVLDVPSRGQGEVVLTGKNFEWKTEKFWTLKVKGQTLFFAAFKTEFRDLKSTIVFKGTYIQAENQIKYYGSFYKKSGHAEFDKELLTGFKYSGGFTFSYQR